MRAFGVRPKRDLGQNFLIDSNILGVIERAAELRPDDVALEIGGGLGVLSEHLAQRTAPRHVVEIDRALEPALRDALAPHPNTTLHLGDALALDLAALDPAPTKVVANLPYGIAATAILRTVFELPSVTRWVAMVQKEVGERFAASAGTSAYGVPASWPSSPATSASTAPSRAPSSTRCPTSTRCSSCCTAPAPRRRPRCGRSSSGAFAHRRKTLAKSLRCTPATSRARATAPARRSRRSACPSDARAERLRRRVPRAGGDAGSRR